MTAKAWRAAHLPDPTKSMSRDMRAAIGQGHFDLVRCVKCQRAIRRNDLPKFCAASLSSKQQSHVAFLGWASEDDGGTPWLAPYGWSDAEWDEQLAVYGVTP